MSGNSNDITIISQESLGIIDDAQQSVDGLIQMIDSLTEQVKNLENVAQSGIYLTQEEKKAIDDAKAAKKAELEETKKLNETYKKVLQSNGVDVSGRSKEQQSKDEKASEKLNSIASKFGFEANVTNGKASFKSNKAENIKETGEGISAAGDAISSLGGKFGKLGGMVSKVGGLLGKFAGPIGLAIQGLQLLGDACSAIADADAKQQDIQNQRNTNLTNRNINLQNIETEAATDTMNTAFENMMSDYNKAFVKLSGDLAITNAKAVAYAETRIGAAIGDVNETAWNALAASTDINAQQLKLNNEVEKTAAIENRAISQRTFGLSGRNIERGYEVQKNILDSQKKDFELTIQDKKNTYDSAFASTFNRAIGGSTEADHVAGDNSGRYEKQYGKGERKGIEGRGVTGSAALGMINTATAGVLDGVLKSGLTRQETVGNRDFTNLTNDLNATSAAASNQIKLQNTAIQNSNKMADKVSSDIADMKNSVIDTQTQIEKAYQKMAQTIEKWYMNFQDKAYESGINKGMTTKGQLDQYRQAMNGNLISLAKKYGITADEMFNMQSGYTAEGRSKMLSGEDMDEQAAFSKIYMGGDFNTTAELANQTEVFNMGVADTVNLMGEMSKEVTKMGLDGRKYLKDATKYLKQAQKYTFNDGVKGMLKMAKTAQQIRFNMDSVSAMNDNIQDGGLEGIITKAAKLQVLGGRFAMGSDPIAMAYESYNDPEALMKRFNSMTQGMGSFNKETGEVTFNGMEKDQLKLLAEYSNQDVTDVMNQARYNVKKDKIDKSQISGDLDETQRAALISKAYMKNGKWMVNDVTGNARDLSSINANNINDVQADTYEGKMSQGMEQIVSFTKLFTGDQEARMSQFSSAMQASGQADKELQDRLQISKDELEQNFNENISKILDEMHQATEAYSNILNQFKESNPNAELETITTKIQGYTKSIDDTLSSILRTMGGEVGNQAADKIELTKKLAGLNFGLGGKKVSAEELIQKGVLYKGKNGSLKINQSEMAKKYGQTNGLEFGSWTTNEINKRMGNKLGISYTGQKKGESFSDFKKRTNAKTDEWNKKNAVTEISFYSPSAGNITTSVHDKSKEKKHTFSDGSVSGGGKPMAVSASKVTPINDGSVSGAISDPNDHAIFAKVGGPFDKLFNGVFKQVNSLYQGIFGGKGNVMPREPIGNNSEFAASDSLESYRKLIGDTKGGNISSNSSTSSNGTFKVEISGTLRLDSNGKSIDIISELQNNPLMLQALSNMIASQMSTKYNGGRPHLDASFR